jgi:hypothetical protein
MRNETKQNVRKFSMFGMINKNYYFDFDEHFFWANLKWYFFFTHQNHIKKEFEIIYSNKNKNS